MAGLLLTALAATLALLAQPSSAASLDSYDIQASIRYGCAQNDGEESFVEVTLRASDWPGGGDHQGNSGAPSGGANPSDTASGSDSASPSGSANPSGSVDPSGSANPSGSGDSSESAGSGSSANPSDSADSSSSANASGSASPTDSAGSSDTAQPSDSASISDSAQPSDSASGSDPANPTDAASPSGSGQSTPAPGDSGDQDNQLVLQVGLAGPESADSDGVFPEGGPTLVTLGEGATKVRLAGPVHDGDHVFIRQLDQPEVITLPLQPTCHRIKPTNFGLDEPSVQVAKQSCTTGSQANLQVTLDNPNDVDQRLQNMGIEQIAYTVLLVRHDGLLAGTDPVGTLISFDEPSASVITLSQVVAKPASYQVRVIGLDGAVVSSNSIRLSCAATVPAPSSSLSPVRPTPTVAPSSATPTTSRPAPSTSRPAPSSPAPGSPTASRPVPSAPASSRTPVPSVPATSFPPSSAPTSSVSAGVRTSAVPQPPTSQSLVPSATSSSTAQVVPPRGSSPAGTAPVPGATSSAAVPAVSSPAPSPTPTSIRLVEPRSDYGALPVFQKDVALVVLVFSAAMAALVGGNLVAARRR